MKIALAGLALIAAIWTVSSAAVAEVRTRERCQAMAEQKGLIGANARELNRRRVYISNCMKGNLKKDRK